jgi:hypothetical protein
MEMAQIIWTREHVLEIFADRKNRPPLHKCDHGKEYDEYCFTCASEGQRKQREGGK